MENQSANQLVNCYLEPHLVRRQKKYNGQLWIQYFPDRGPKPQGVGEPSHPFVTWHFTLLHDIYFDKFRHKVLVEIQFQEIVDWFIWKNCPKLDIRYATITFLLFHVRYIRYDVINSEANISIKLKNKTCLFICDCFCIEFDYWLIRVIDYCRGT